MSRMSELDLCVGELKSAAQSLNAVAESLTILFSGNEPVEAAQPEPAVKPVTLEQVRAVLAEKSHNGFTAEVRGLLEKHGASKLSQIDPVNYAALLVDAEALK